MNFNTASFLVGHFLNEFYFKFDLILKDSLTLVTNVEKTKSTKNYILFTVNFESLHMHILDKDATEIMKKNTVLKTCLMSFNG